MQSEVLELISKTTTPCFRLCLLDVEAHHVQCAGTFEVYAIEREEAFLYECPSIGDDGVSGRLSDHFDAHTGFDEDAVGVFAHFRGDDESWHSSKSFEGESIGERSMVGNHGRE